LVVGLGAIVLVVCLVLAAKIWHWLHVVLVFLVFAAAVGGAVVASRSLKTRSAWMDQARKNEQRMKEEQQQLEAALYGPANEVALTNESLRGITIELKLAELGKGRVWPNGTVAVDGEQIVITYPADGVVRPAQLQQDMKVYAFRDDFAEIGGRTVALPAMFVGSFRVASADANGVRLEPLFVVPTSQTELTQPTNSWSLFEKMPNDDHDAFLVAAGLTREDLNIGEFRQLLIDKYLPADKMGLDPASPEYQALIDRYTFDGLRLNDIAKWLAAQPDRQAGFDPPLTDRAQRVRFLEPSRAYAVDGEGNLREGPLNPSGQAVAPELRAGRDVKFEKGEQATFDRTTASDGYQRTEADREPPLTESESIEILEEYYVRPLNNYAYGLEKFLRDTADLGLAIDEVNRDIVITTDALAQAAAQERDRAELKAKLTEDRDRFTQDRDAARALVEARQRDLEEAQAQIDTYYKQIVELHESIRQHVARHRELSDSRPDGF
jgi:hypothetical protein